MAVDHLMNRSAASQPTKAPTTGSTTGRTKPQKPYPDFPLTAHPAGYWCKKIRGKLHYFGCWEDPDGALAAYNAVKDDLHAGRRPKTEGDEGATVKELCNRFLNAKQLKVDSGELSPRTWDDYKRACDEMIEAFGKRRALEDLDPADFDTLRSRMAKKWGPHHLGKIVQCVRSAVKYACDIGLTDRVVRFGPDFKKPSKKTMRRHRERQGVKMFTPQQIRAMIRIGAQPLKAMILLGVNCGFGNNDCATLAIKALDLPRAWCNHARPKTGIPRRNPLWPETVAALREAIAARPKPKTEADAQLVFLTRCGQPWGHDDYGSAITHEFTKLMKRLKLYRGNGRAFYVLRHVFGTVGGETTDQVAVDALMGHADNSMAGQYRERIADDRLKAVAEHVRAWLFGAT